MRNISTKKICPDAKAGVYLHIPFCKSLCSYCDFAKKVETDNAVYGTYTTALLQTILWEQNDEVDTVYFGGGTPSLFSSAQIGRLLEGVCERFEVTADAEVTIEINPGTVTKEKLREYRSLGINRASFGVQTFNDRHLKLLARGHDSNDAIKTLELLRDAGFENISFDLIAGLPGQTIEDWTRNLDKALELSPEHLSLYILEIHKDTPLAKQLKSERRTLPEEEVTAEMYQLILDKIEDAGLTQYEISNFAKPGFESRHNSKYWKMEPVYGFGVSAHSFDGINRRWSITRDLDQFMAVADDGFGDLETEEILTSEQLLSEFAFLSMRMNEGLDLTKAKELFGVDVYEKYQEDLDRLAELRLIDVDDSRIVLTERGLLYSNEVFEIFV